jgi:hypothetical protein
VRIKPTSVRPTVLFTGDCDHKDFREAAGALTKDADLVLSDSSPELIVVAHARPGSVSFQKLDSLRRAAPLASVLVLAGTWCEGEARTGRVWQGVQRLYWYEFTAWWRQQLTFRAAGACPDWARPDEFRSTRSLRRWHSSSRASHSVLLTTHDDAAYGALADVVLRAGYIPARATGSLVPSGPKSAAAIWDGGQLSPDEEQQLSRLCERVMPMPTIALLDFPRRDRIDRAVEIGASAVLGKPWSNVSLLATLESVIAVRRLPLAA